MHGTEQHEQDSPELATERSLRDIEKQVFELRRDVSSVRREVPGIFSIAIGVMLGMFLYSVVGVFLTMMFWASVVTWVASRAQSERTFAPQQREIRPFNSAPGVPGTPNESHGEALPERRSWP
jgi:hypothetical protein